MIKMIPLFVLGLFITYSCEGELDDLGSQLVDVNGADALDKAYALIAYNVDNNDIVRTESSRLDSVRIGAFSESIFGGQKVSYVTQLRLSSYNPDFGKNPVIDSVVLTLKPRYQTDSANTTTIEDYIYPDGNVAAKKVVTTYPVTKYGRVKTGKEISPLTIKVHDVTDFLGSPSDSILSNKAVSLGAQIGSKSFNGNVNSVVITKDGENTDLVNRAVSFRMKLDSAFFQTKIIAKQGDQVLKDAASFIRYFKGISISVDQNDGYLFSMAPNDTYINIYYKNDVTATDGTVTRTKAEVALNLGAGNVHFSQIDYKNRRTGTDYESAMKTAINVKDLKTKDVTPANYAPKLYLQGMGGSGIGIKIPEKTIEGLKKLYKENKIAIVSAKIRLYNDSDSWSNNYPKPVDLLIREKDQTRFLLDMSKLANVPGFSLIKTSNLSTKDAYYDITITTSLKNIIENNSTSSDFVINLGSYSTDPSTGYLLGQDFSNRAFTPNRIVLRGADVDNIGEEIKDSKMAQLRLIYTKK